MFEDSLSMIFTFKKLSDFLYLGFIIVLGIAALTVSFLEHLPLILLRCK
jgi:hypothetical protein